MSDQKVSWFKTAKIPTEPTPTAILVTNISPAATSQNLHEFFSFCGEVEQLEVIPWEDETTKAASQRAFVQFKHEPAARTALLLSDATIVDQPITIAPYFEGLASPAPSEGEDEVLAMVESQPLFEEHIQQEDKPKQSIVADLLQRGYRLGDKIMADAERFDDAHGLSKRFKSFFVAARARGVQFNNRYQVVERSQSVFESAKSKAAALVDDVKQLDQRYHVTDRFTEFATATGHAAAEVANNIDKKLHIKERAVGAANAAAGFVGKVMATATGRGDVEPEPSNEQVKQEETVTEQPTAEGEPEKPQNE